MDPVRVASIIFLLVIHSRRWIGSHADTVTSDEPEMPSAAALPTGLESHRSFVPLVDYRLLTAYGVRSNQTEVKDTPSKVTYEIGNREVSEKKFFEAASDVGIDLAFTSNSGSRGYPNQDNFLVEIVQRKIENDNGAADKHKLLFGLFAVWDGHGVDGHVITEFMRRATQKAWRKEIQELLDVAESLDSDDRNTALLDVTEQIFKLAQEEYNLNIAYWSDSELESIANELSELRKTFSVESGAKQSGATMSIVVIDFSASKLYTGGAGDSPIMGKFKDGALDMICDDHNTENSAERQAVIRRLEDNGFHFEGARTEITGNKFAYYLSWHKQTDPSLSFEEAEYFEIDCYPHPLETTFDFRTGGLQPARGVGHWYTTPGVSTQPAVRMFDMKKNPFDYVLLASDGLMHSIERRTRVFIDRLDVRTRLLVREFLKRGNVDGDETSHHSDDDEGVYLFPSVFQESFLDMFRTADLSNNDVLATYRKFEAAMDRRKESADALAKYLISYTLDEFTLNNLDLFPEQIRRLGRLEDPSNTDDLTAMFILFPTAEAAVADTPSSDPSPLSNPVEVIAQLEEQNSRLYEAANGIDAFGDLTSPPEVADTGEEKMENFPEVQPATSRLTDVKRHSHTDEGGQAAMVQHPEKDAGREDATLQGQ